MAETSHSAAARDSPSKAKPNRRRGRAQKPAAVVEAGKDVQADTTGSKQDVTGPSSTTTSEKKKSKRRSSQATSSQPLPGVDAGTSQIESVASLGADQQSKHAVGNAVKTPSSKGKGKVSKNTAASNELSQGPKLPFLRLSDPLGKSARLAPVFSQDGRFCFVAAASSVKIYRVSTCQLLSTLDLPALSNANQPNSLYKANNQVTSLFVNPNNGLQVITTSLDGFVRVWDYLEGKVLYSADMGGPIPCAAMVQPDSLAFQQTHLKETLFLAVNRGSSIAETSTLKQQSVPTSIVFCISLKRSEISNQTRLGKCRDAVGLSISSDGNSVVVIGKKKIHIASIATSKSGTVVSKAPFISFEGFPSSIHYNQVEFTTVLCHPSESYFATGDTRGTIRLWYILTEDSLNAIRTAQEKRKESSKGGKKGVDVVPNGALAVLHWHAHAVSSLAFTPNGAYLLSGGEEAVLVVWQIASRHQEFVPRIGAPIEALTIINGLQSGQQEFVARLKDGAIVFLGAGTLKVLRTIAGVKTIEQFTKKEGSDLPLAIEPMTNRLVFQASHPSTIQFYSATQDMHVYEQDISPSNRVSRTDDRPIEPVRVEHIAFCASSSSGTSVPALSSSGGAALQLANGSGGSGMRGAVWMATFDTWQDREYTRESHLKFWMGFPSYKPGYGLISRIDNPHGNERISSMSFSSPDYSGGGGAGKLATTSLDGTIKIWSYRLLHDESNKQKITKKKNDSNKSNTSSNVVVPNGIWQCLFSLTYRSYGAIKAKFSNDGSLLAVLHSNHKATLWNSENGNLIKAFNISEQDVGHHLSDIAFAGKNGTRLLAGGEQGHVIWDLLTLEEVDSVPIPARQIITPSTYSPSDLYTVISEKSSTLLSVSDVTYASTHALPFALARAVYYPSSPSSSSSLSTTSARKEEVVVAAIAKSGQVALLGSNTALRGIRPVAFEDSANLQAALNTVEILGEELRPVRLFDELFGESSLSTTTPSTSSVTSLHSSVPAGSGSATKRDIFDEIPSHKLPSLSSLWRDLITPGLLPIAGPSSTLSTLQTKTTGLDSEKDEEASDDDEEEDDEGQMEEDRSAQNEEEDEEEEEEEAGLATKEDLEYVNLNEEDLINIFSKGMDDAFSAFRGKSIPSDRLASKAGRDKSKKKRKSLLASMV